VPVTVHVIGGDGLRDPYGERAAQREVGPSGVVLVRPDQHVAWRTVAMTANSANHLTAVLRSWIFRAWQYQPLRRC
jgi:2,4-dichlorophenol 6-monooxygenase